MSLEQPHYQPPSKTSIAVINNSSDIEIYRTDMTAVDEDLTINVPVDVAIVNSSKKIKICESNLTTVKGAAKSVVKQPVSDWEGLSLKDGQDNHRMLEYRVTPSMSEMDLDTDNSSREDIVDQRSLDVQNPFKK
ncbi:hypothetical protein H2248_000021 [Termitomyces sp. 'cryptogamus']|nr:hypothetical protein H2248_000021 [Termitomyces sp. 'cryptogamus']